MTERSQVNGSLHQTLKYALITAARNEERFIEQTLGSVIRQTLKPVRYVVVDDGSSDRTADLVRQAIVDHPWITLVQLPPRRERHFAGKVVAFNAGLEQLHDMAFDIVGNLDADVSLEPDHCEYLLLQFAADPKLGVAGTIYTQPGFDSTADSFEGEECVAGPLQLFRRECFEQVGGYVPSRLGGVDWIAVTTARMRGWRTRAFAGRRFHHHRLMGTASTSVIGARFAYGRKDYMLGGSLLWELARACYQITKRPYAIGGLALLSGYISAAATRTEHVVSPELLKFHRREQSKKLSNIFYTLLTTCRLEKFRAGAQAESPPDVTLR